MTLSTCVLFERTLDPCGNDIKQEVISPDGRYTATAFIRDCGATTSYSPQVYLRKAEERMAETGNVFTGYRSDEINISWASATELVISCNCEVRRYEKEFSGIVITLKAK
jgi:uncharacterized protein DUF5412